jgi:hypothetical protein
MKKSLSVCFALLVLLSMATGVMAQGSFEYITGKPFDDAVPKDFYLEGNSIPTEKRNAGLVKTPEGKRVVFALIDTTGYSSQIQQKYMGMLISEGSVSVCGNKIGVGSYGFGLNKAASSAQFVLYNQAGTKVADCDVKSDAELMHPTPLQVKLQSGKVLLYLGRYRVDLEP